QHVHRYGEKTALAPLDLVLLAAISERRVTAASHAVEELFVKEAARRKRLACGDLVDDGVHVDVAGEVDVDAAAADFRPGPGLLGLGVHDGVTLDLRDLGVLGPLAIEVALDAPAAADVFGAVDHVVVRPRLPVLLLLL